MVNLYEYNNASYEECIDDLNDVIESLQNNTSVDDYFANFDILERQGIRIQNIAQRLKELGDKE